MAKVNNRFYECVTAFNREWAFFVNRRLKEDLAVPQQVAECKSIQDMYRLYAVYIQSAYSQYQSGFEQMVKLGRSMTEDTLKVLQSRLGDAAWRK